jgi:preprotein translocase subunit SecG
MVVFRRWMWRSPFASSNAFAIFRLPMNLLINFCLVFFVLVASLMVFVILMQRPKSEGLGAAFGAGVTDNIFGAQTTNVLVKFTTWLAGIFFALTFALSVLYAHQSTASSAFRRELMKNQPVPQTSPAAVGSQSSPASSAATSPGSSPATSPATAGAQSSPAVSAAGTAPSTGVQSSAALSPAATAAPTASP